ETRSGQARTSASAFSEPELGESEGVIGRDQHAKAETDGNGEDQHGKQDPQLFARQVLAGGGAALGASHTANHQAEGQNGIHRLRLQGMQEAGYRHYGEQMQQGGTDDDLARNAQDVNESR